MSMFQRLGNQSQQAQDQQQQNPREVAMERMKQMGIDVPQGLENDPQGIIQHLMQSGRFPQSRLNMAQQMMQRMYGGRR